MFLEEVRKGSRKLRSQCQRQYKTHGLGWEMFGTPQIAQYSCSVRKALKRTLLRKVAAAMPLQLVIRLPKWQSRSY